MVAKALVYSSSSSQVSSPAHWPPTFRRRKMKVHFNKREVEEILGDSVEDKIRHKCRENAKGSARIIEIGNIEWKWTMKGITAKSPIISNTADC
jgi:hypothetical protein